MAGLVFVDTWAWVAVLDRKDADHAMAEAVYRRLVEGREVLVTTNLVLAETVSFLRRKSVSTEVISRWARDVDAAATRGRVQVVDVSGHDLLEIYGALQAFADRPSLSATDVASIRVIRQHRITRVFTNDNDFKDAAPDLELLGSRDA